MRNYLPEYWIIYANFDCAHKILFSQKVRNYSKFHILDKLKNRDNRFLVPDLDLEIFFAHFESLIYRKRNISI